MACKTSVTSLLKQLHLETLEERSKIQRPAFILNGQVAVATASINLILSRRPSCSTDINQQKPITVKSYDENYSLTASG